MPPFSMNKVTKRARQDSSHLITWACYEGGGRRSWNPLNTPEAMRSSKAAQTAYPSHQVKLSILYGRSANLPHPPRPSSSWCPPDPLHAMHAGGALVQASPCPGKVLRLLMRSTVELNQRRITRAASGQCNVSGEGKGSSPEG